MVEFEEKYPICPYCEQQITGTREMYLGSEKIFYLCPKCGKILSVGKP